MMMDTTPPLKSPLRSLAPVSSFFKEPQSSRSRVARSCTQQVGSRLSRSRNYAAKDIRFGVEALALMLKGVEELADAIKVTMDPKVVDADALIGDVCGLVEKMQSFFMQQDMLPVLNELRHAPDIESALESLVEEGNYSKVGLCLWHSKFYPEYLQLLDSFSELSAVQEMSRGVVVWLGKSLQKLDSLLLGVCQEIKEGDYLTGRNVVIEQSWGAPKATKSRILVRVL